MVKCVVCGKEFTQKEFKLLAYCDECNKLSKRRKAEIKVKRELSEHGELETYNKDELEREISFMMKILK